MLLIAGLSLGFFFLYLGHSTLLYFYVEKHKGDLVPLRNAVLPWSNRGRVVGCLCLVLAIGFSIIGARGLAEFHGMGRSEWIVFSIFVVFPATWYSIYLFRRINSKNGELSFKATQSTSAEALIPLVVAAAILFLTGK